MRLRGITLDDFNASVARVNVMVTEEGKTYNGNLRVHQDAHEIGSRVITTVGRLTVESSREAGARRSWSGRRCQAACWHAFRDVVRDLLANHPDAVISTSMARYTADNFEDTYPQTGERNIGSMVQHAYMPDLCDCEV